MQVQATYAMGLAGYEIELDARGENVTYRYVAPNLRDKEKHAKIQSTKRGRAYFVANGKRIHLDECLRTNI